MQELKIYISGIVFSSLASAIAFMLLPNGKIPKHIRMVVSVALLIFLISPIFNLSANFKKINSDADTALPQQYTNLEETQRQQRVDLAKKNFSESVSDILKKNGITTKSVHIYVSNENGEIQLHGISVSLPSTTTASEKIKTERIVTEVFGLEPSIELER